MSSSSILQKENEDLQVRIEELLEINDTHRQLNGELRKELQMEEKLLKAMGENFMTSILKDDDKIFTMYKQYKELLHKDVEKNDNRIYGIDQLAVQLTIAHMLDHVVCLFKEDKPKINKDWKKVVMVEKSGVVGKEEMVNEPAVKVNDTEGEQVGTRGWGRFDEHRPSPSTTSTSVNSIEIDWGRIS